MEVTMSVGSNSSYPVTFSVDYPEDPLNRLSTALRIFYIIPIAIVVSVIANSTQGVLFLPAVLLIVFRQKYPRWWFDWNLEFMRFSNRVSAYALLLRDEYPSTDEQQAVHLEFAYPDAENDLNRWLPLIKWLLAIPHYIVLAILGIAAIVVVIIAWFAILFTGTYPRGLFNFVVGVMRWQIRVTAYAFTLVTDEYPPFSLN